MIDISDYEAAAGDVDAEGFGPMFINRRDSGEAVVRGAAGLRERVLEITNLEVDDDLTREDVIALIVIVYLFGFTDDYYRAHADRVSLTWADGATTVTFNYPAAN